MTADSRITQLAVAIRMTVSDPELFATPNHQPRIAVFDDSPQAISLSESQNPPAGQSCLFFPESVDGAGLAQSLTETIGTSKKAPSAVAVKNLGVFGIGRTSGEARRSLQALYGDSDSAPVADDGAGRYQRLAGRVVVITGSAQGFGKGIAEELARDGAHLIIADINEEKGLETCGMINEQSSNNSAVFCRTDVTSEDSLDACIQQAVRSFGGVDMFIANAGILKAGALHELDPKAFELVTKVNYSAYYLCARAAAPVMKLQNSYNPRYSMDIIQVNSKSGLQGSNKNFAYAGSKFGTIGLTQSFAMELIEYSIKVNSVCPGNFFDGPLWSDPKNGLFVQYLNAGKVPGAKTIEDVRRFYVNKVPMRRGCLPRDVARAIVYAHEQEYETGQAIPVTGGQVMLK